MGVLKAAEIMAENDTGKSGTASAASLQGGQPSPLIFISHDTRDGELAEAFSKLLSSVSAGVLKSFRSSDKKSTQGIEYGTEWYPKLMSQLDCASDVVCLLTPRSFDRPWILFEAGVAKGKLNTPVHGVALGIPMSRVHVGPFAQFQNVDDDETSLTKLVMQLVSRIPGAEPDREAIQMQVLTFKKRAAAALETLSKALAPSATKPPVEETSVAKLFEEVKVMFQDLPSRLDTKLAEGTDRGRRRRLRRFHPMMFEEMSHMATDDPSDPVGILILASVLRDDMPWLYEIGMEAYRAARAGHSRAAEEALDRFRRVAKFSTRGPWIEEFGMPNKEMDMMFMELPMIIDNMRERWAVRSRKAAGKKSDINDQTG